MKSLHTLLRVAKRNLETLRRALGEQLKQQSIVEESIRALGQNLAAEQERARQDYEATRAYTGFAVAVGQRRQALAARAAEINTEADRLRAMIADAHVEMKKFERLLELQADREAAMRDQRERQEMDELATQRAARTGRA